MSVCGISSDEMDARQIFRHPLGSQLQRSRCVMNTIQSDPRSAEPSEPHDLSFLSGGGELGALMRAHDWSGSLGPPTLWSQALCTAVRLILNTGHPMYVFWGPALACLYNDAYRQSIGPERHPGSLGRPAQEVWSEIWDIIGPQIEQVMSGGGATWHVDQLVPITRHGRREDVYWARRRHAGGRVGARQRGRHPRGHA